MDRIAIAMMISLIGGADTDCSRVVSELYKTSQVHVDHWRQLNSDKVADIYIQSTLWINPHQTTCNFRLFIYKNKYDYETYTFKDYYYGLTLEQVNDIVQLTSKKLRSYVGIRE